MDRQTFRPPSVHLEYQSKTVCCGVGRSHILPQAQRFCNPEDMLTTVNSKQLHHLGPYQSNACEVSGDYAACQDEKEGHFHMVLCTLAHDPAWRPKLTLMISATTEKVQSVSKQKYVRVALTKDATTANSRRLPDKVIGVYRCARYRIARLRHWTWRIQRISNMLVFQITDDDVLIWSCPGSDKEFSDGWNTWSPVEHCDHV